MPDILHRVDVAAAPMRVFEALTTVEGIRNWWSEEPRAMPWKAARSSSAATGWRLFTPTRAS